MTGWRRFRLAFSMSKYSRLTLSLLLAMILQYAGAASHLPPYHARANE